MAIVPIISELWLLASILLMIGIAEGVLDVGGNTLLVWLHREKMGPYMNGLHFFFGLGAFISPVIIAQTVFYSGDINWSYWVLALLMLPSAIWLLRIPSPPYIVTSPSISIRQVLPILIILLSVFDFLYVGAEVAFGSWIYTYATSMGLGTKVTGAYLTSVFWGALTVGRLASIPIAKRFSPQIIIFIDLIILLTSLAMIIRSDVSNQVFALWVGTFGVGLGMASIFPTILTLAGKYMTITGYVTSWFFVGSSLGGMILPWIVGQLFDFAGPQVIMLVIFASIIIEMILFFGIMLYIKRLNKTY